MPYEEVSHFDVDCGCGCSTIEISQWKSNEGCEEVNLAHKIRSFNSYYKPSWRKFVRTIKMIWCILSGKEYYFFDIVLTTKEQISSFKEGVSRLEENVVVPE